MRLGKYLVFFICFLVLLNCFVLQCYPEQEDHPNVILITIDALRPDHLGCYGYKRNTSPNIDKLAQEGVMFTQAIAQAPWTVPSVVSILTSTYPFEHRVNDFGINFPAELTSLSDILKTYGYISGCMSNLSGFDGIPNLDEEFDTYITRETYQWRGLPIKFTEITEKAKEWINKNKKGKFFLWLHLWDTHTPPLNPPSPYSSLFFNDEYSKSKINVPVTINYRTRIGGLNRALVENHNNVTDINYYIAIYDGAIRYVDEQIESILNHLNSLRLDKNTLILISADHGEGIGEHNLYFTHGFNLYDELIKVPLVIKYEKLFPRNKKIDIQIQTIDMAPTILDVLGIKKPSSMKGVSLLPLIYDDKEKYPAKFSFANQALENLYSIRTPEWKLIYDANKDKYEFYNLQEDPNELNNLIKSTSFDNYKIFLSLKRELKKQLKRTNRKRGKTKYSLERETEEKLKSLGYLQ
jgi:arylsulfatase A-like enzyme